MRVFGFDGPNEVFILDSLTPGVGDVEAVDVAKEKYVFFADDGVVIEAAVRGGRVVFTPTGIHRGDELRERLRVYLSQPGVGMDPALANDPVALGAILRERERADEWPRRWLVRLGVWRKPR